MGKWSLVRKRGSIRGSRKRNRTDRSSKQKADRAEQHESRSLIESWKQDFISIEGPDTLQKDPKQPVDSPQTVSPAQTGRSGNGSGTKMAGSSRQRKTLPAVLGCHEADLASLGCAGGFIHNISVADPAVNWKAQGGKRKIMIRTGKPKRPE